MQYSRVYRNQRLSLQHDGSKIEGEKPYTRHYNQLLPIGMC